MCVYKVSLKASNESEGVSTLERLAASPSQNEGGLTKLVCIEPWDL